MWKGQVNGDGAIPGSVVVDGIKKQAKQALGNKQESNIIPLLCLQFLSPDSCFGFPQWTVTQDM